MKRKPKLSLIINISVICLCVCAIAIGVYSVKNASLSVSGTIGFNAHDCEMLIKGTMQGYQLDDDGINTTAVTKYFNETNSVDGGYKTVKDGTNDSWALGSLVFDDLHTTGSKQVNDIIFTFEITNNSDFYVDVTVDQDFIGNDRIFVYAPNNGETLSPKSASEGKSITLTVKLQLQPDANGVYSKLESAIDLSKAKSLLNFKKIDAPATLSTDWGKMIYDGFGITDKFSWNSSEYETLAKKVTVLKFVNEISESDLSGVVVNADGTPKGISVKSTNSQSDITAYLNTTSKILYIYSPARIYVQDIDSVGLGYSDVSRFFAYFCYWQDIEYQYCPWLNLNTLDLDNFDTSKMTNMSKMFSYTYEISELNLRGLDTTNVTNMCKMFEVTSVTKLDLRNFNTNKVTDMSCMFWSDSSGTNSSLTELYVDNFDTSSVTNMSYMFYWCYVLKKLDLRSFDTEKVTDMSYMFSNTGPWSELHLESFSSKNLSDYTYMFENVDTDGIYFGNDWKIEYWNEF